MFTHVAIIKIVKPVRVVPKVALLKVVLRRKTRIMRIKIVVEKGGVVAEVVAKVSVDFQCITMMATLYEDGHYEVALSRKTTCLKAEWLSNSGSYHPPTWWGLPNRGSSMNSQTAQHGPRIFGHRHIT